MKELLTSFGQLKAFNLVKDVTSGLSKVRLIRFCPTYWRFTGLLKIQVPKFPQQGYAFAEYLDGGVTDQAIAGLNGMQVSAKYMERFLTGAIVAAGRQEADRAARECWSQNYGHGQYPGSDTGNRSQACKSKKLATSYWKPSIGAWNGRHGRSWSANWGSLSPQHGRRRRAHGWGVIPSHYWWSNEIDKANSEDFIWFLQEEYEDILEDIREECGKFGEVKSVEIPRPVPGVEVPGKPDSTWIPCQCQLAGCGKVFIEFANSSDCQAAQLSLTGRKFSNRVVVTRSFFFTPFPALSCFLSSYYNPEKYHRREFWATGWWRCRGLQRRRVWFHIRLLHNTVRDWNKNFCRFTLLL